jgi:DHA3 family macrolide efflux protein-like MFS transporter
MDTTLSHRGFFTFTLVAVGQIVSVTGSALTGFALGVWVYQSSHSTTQFSLILLFSMLPSLLVAPLTGALVDRWDRRWVMILSDTGAGLCTATLALLIFLGRLDIWQIYLITAISSVLEGFQVPAYMATVSLLVPKEQLGRANGIMQLGSTSRYLLAPILAGWLMGKINVTGVMLIDFATFIFAVTIVLAVRFPKPRITPEGQSQRGSLWREVRFGWQYISARPGLVGLLILFALGNYANLMVDTLLPPMLLETTTPDVLGSVLSAGGLGMLAGSLLMSAWGGPKRRIYGVFIFKSLAGLAILLIGGAQSLFLVALGTFFYYFPFPLVNGCDQAIWQSKVAPDVQGRVFAMRRMLAYSMIPLAYVTAGPLSDGVFKPLMYAGGPLATRLGPLIGSGPGRGQGLLIILMGGMIVLLTLATVLNPRVRRVEEELADTM